MSGSHTIRQIPQITAAALPNVTAIAADAYTFGSSIVLVLSAALIGLGLAFILRFVPDGGPRRLNLG